MNDSDHPQETSICAGCADAITRLPSGNWYNRVTGSYCPGIRGTEGKMRHRPIAADIAPEGVNIYAEVEWWRRDTPQWVSDLMRDAGICDPPVYASPPPYPTRKGERND